MPVFKFKSFDDADKAHWNVEPDDEYFKRVAELWEFANKLSSIEYPKGIFKFKTIEEANRHREEIEIAHAKQLRAKRKSSKQS